MKAAGNTGGLISEFQGITGSYAREGQPLERHLCGPVFGSEAAAHLQERIVRQRQGRINALLSVQAVVSRNVRIPWMRERCRFQAHAELPIRAGFTLIEMSIVLVIIGLIVGAVLAGQSLILQAQMRATMKQIESYKTAVATFRDKYSCLPGDCATATSFWPKDPACTYQNLRPYIAAPNGMTCNGDGNGIIYGYYYNELMLFWQHLSLAGLIQGSFTGTCGYGPSDDCYSSVHYFDYRVNLDAPAAPIGSAGITLTYPLLQWPGDPRFNQTAMNGQHVFWMGAPGTTDGSGNSIISGYPQPMLTPKQAYALDTKYDDGSPFTGTIMEGFKRPWSLCDNNVSYFTTGTTGDTIECTVMFLGGF